MKELIINITSTYCVVGATVTHTGADAATTPAAGEKKVRFDLTFV